MVTLGKFSPKQPSYALHPHTTDTIPLFGTTLKISMVYDVLLCEYVTNHMHAMPS